ncbi:hypothetical protein [Bradyrhizobium symbiodeficiens]|uniref:hypothetical protein n=1 Tax=Bradyrhizobium symbiodeficiens TaxID=1404367 RepID=UPI00140FC523|nr:hypothetical protein [Bradyrhizobium symbiodeficiens]QIO98898.1 hypothetical protein HAU86_03390 [Bradyrhizobium symbiodeficiens]
MSAFATSLLLAGSFVLADPAHFQTNTMLRDAAVAHDMAKVKLQFERALHRRAGSIDQAFPTGLPPTDR